VRRRVEVSGHSEDEAYQGEECRDRVNDQDGGERVSSARWQIEAPIRSKEAICVQSALACTLLYNAASIARGVDPVLTSQSCLRASTPNLPRRTSIISNINITAPIPFAPPPDPEVVSLIAAQRNGLDNRHGQRRQQQQNECEKEQYGQRCSRP
jgi:hypothetical protein